MKELAEEQFILRQQATTIIAGEADGMYVINGRKYQLVLNYRDAFDKEKLAARFSELLEKYDYFVGDIAADQLRIRGWYKDGTEGISRSQQISALQDYLFEDINFGAPYFVFENLEPHALPEEEEEAIKRPRRRNNTRSGSKNSGAAISERRTKQPDKQTGRTHENTNERTGNTRGAQNRKPKQATTKGSNGRRRFQIKEREVNRKRNDNE
jgi:uncharacterized protein YutD